MADEAKKDEKKPAGFGAILEAILGTVAAGLLAVLSGLKNLSVDQLTDAVENTVEDIKFGLGHFGVIWANRVGAFWDLCLGIYLIDLIWALLAKGLVLTSWSSVLFALVFAAGRAGLYWYGWHVTDAGALDHRDRRRPVDVAAREVARLEAMQKDRDPKFEPADLFAAQNDHSTKLAAYVQWVNTQGPQNRSAVGLLLGHFIISCALGITLVYGVVGQRENGTYSYDQVFWYVVGGCTLPFFIYLLPLIVLIIVSPFSFNRAGNAEDVATFLHLSIKALGVIGKGFAEIEKEHLAALAANGDQKFRNASLIAKQHWMEFWTSTGIKVLGAEALLMRHCLGTPSLIAFLWSMFFGLAAWFTEKRLEKYNVLKEDQRKWPSMILSAIGIAVYPHMWFAGGAPRAYWGLNYYLSDYGPFGTLFGSDSQHTSNAVGMTADAVGQPTKNYVSHFLGMSGTGTAVFWLLGMIVVGALYAIWRPTSNILKTEDKEKADGTVKKVMKTLFICFAGFMTIPLVVYVFQAPLHLEQRADVARATARSTATQMTPSSVSGASTTFDSDVRRRCALNTLNQPPCEPACYEFHGWSSARVNIEAGARNGTCYVVPWYSVGNSVSR